MSTYDEENEVLVSITFPSFAEYLSARLCRTVVGYARRFEQIETDGPIPKLLLFHYVYGHGGEACQHSTRELAQILNSSIGKSAIAQARNRLIELRLIEVRPRNNNPASAGETTLKRSEKGVQNLDVSKIWTRKSHVANATARTGLVSKEVLNNVGRDNVTGKVQPTLETGPLDDSTLSVFDEVENNSSFPAAMRGGQGARDASLDVFDVQPPLTTASASHRSSGPRFSLTPPNEPIKGAGPVRPPSKPDVKDWAIKKVLAICYGLDTQDRLKMADKRQVILAATCVKGLREAGEDLGRLQEVADWWNSWATYLPTPNYLLSYWNRAIAEIDRAKQQGVAEDEESRARRLRAEESARSEHEYQMAEYRRMEKRAVEYGDPVEIVEIRAERDAYLAAYTQRQEGRK